MTLTRSGSEVAEYFALLGEQEVQELDGSSLRARYNIAPSQLVLSIVAAEAGAADVAPDRGGRGSKIPRRIAWKQWGLVPSWAKDPGMGGRLFNARSETVATKPSFRSAFKRRRCLVVSDGFYEWTPRNRDHRPFHFRAATGKMLALAGLYEEWRGQGGEVIESCTVLTTEANSDLEGVHHRMPAILAPTDFDDWLDPTRPFDGASSRLAPSPAGTLSRKPVSRYVNNPRHDDEACLNAPDQGGDAAAAQAASLVADPQQIDFFETDGGAEAK